MNRNKKIILSASIALAIVIIFNIIINNYLNKTKVEIYAVKDTILEGEQISADMLEKVYVENANGYVTSNNIKDIISKIAIKNLEKGKLLVKNDIVTESEYNSETDKVLMAIPINNYENAVGYQLSKGDLINIYYTSKVNQTGEILKDYEKIYSSTSNESGITAKILEDICIQGLYDQEGKEVVKGKPFNQILIKVDKQVAIKLLNLKGQGVFDICLMN